MRRITRFLPIILFAAAALSCSNDDIGIFSSLSKETPIDELSSEYFQNATPKFVAFSAASSCYFAATNALYRRDIGPTDPDAWEKVTLPVSGMVSGGAGDVDGSHVYVAVCDANTGAHKAILGWNGASFVEVGDATLDGKLVSGLAVANDTLFVSVTDTTVTPMTNHIYYLNGGVYTSTTVTAATGPVTGAAYDTSDFWVSAGSTVYNGAAASLATATGTGVPSGIRLGGVAAVGSRVFVSGANGVVYSAVGTTWNNSADIGSGGAIVATANDRLLVGALSYAGTGYKEFDLSTAWVTGKGESARVTADDVNYKTSLSEARIISLASFSEGATTRVFATTFGEGLWSNSFNGTKWDAWIKE